MERKKKVSCMEMREALQQTGCDDSGVAISGDVGEQSCSGEYDNIDNVVCEIGNDHEKYPRNIVNTR